MAEFKLAAPTIAQGFRDPAGAYAVLPDHRARPFDLAEIGLNDARIIGSAKTKGRQEKQKEETERVGSQN